MSGDWPYKDSRGAELDIDPGRGECSLVSATMDGVYVAVADLPKVVERLYTACGLPAPVILGRPEIDPAAEERDGDFGVRLSDGGGVILAIGGACVERSPEGARWTAALIAAYAEAASEATAEPDPEAVDELAMVLMEGNPTVMGLDGARPTARRILAAGYRREARDDG